MQNETIELILAVVIICASAIVFKLLHLKRRSELLKILQKN